MDKLAPKARFDAYAALLGLDASGVDSIRHSIRPLLANVNELVRRMNEVMTHAGAAHVLGDVAGERRERLQSLLASFILRTVNCNFDEEYCNYAHDISHNADVPAGLFNLGLTLANDFVAQTLPLHIDEREQLAAMLASWNRLTAALRELTRKPAA